MNRVSLFEEYRLIERSEAEINGAWKGAHLLLFFMAFVFGSFCTFCFHVLMYLFDEKCVLFPKLLSLTSLRHNVIYEFIPVDKEAADMLPVDFVGTQWMEKSACYLPTYVPLVSGIFGLVWTTMFLMCSIGSRTLTGLQRPWRVLPPVFIFSLAMSGLCIYSSSVTHYGLNELCIKLGEITGSATCTYTVNVATLAYERRIRGVYQAISLTILSAWLHTVCWLLSALLTLARVVLAVDFQLVRINVDLIGNIDKMLEHHETQIRTVSPDTWFNDENGSDTSLPLQRNEKTQFSTQTEPKLEDEDIEVLYQGKSDNLYVPKYKGIHFDIAAGPSTSLANANESKEVANEIRHILQEKLDEQLHEIHRRVDTSSQTSTSSVKPGHVYESTLNITDEMKTIIESKRASDAEPKKPDAEIKVKKSNLKNTSVQTDHTKKVTLSPRVQITEPENVNESTETNQDAEKETQTQKKKEKQD